MPGAGCTRSLVCSEKSTRVSHHEYAGNPGIPRAMVLTVSFELSSATGLSCHRRPRDCGSNRRRLDASVGASGPHDFAVRLKRVRLRAEASTASRAQRFVTIAKRPSEGGGTESLYFCFYRAVKQNSENQK